MNHSKKELRELCDNARREPCMSSMGTVYVFSMPGYPTQHVYDANERKLWLIHTQVLPNPLTGEAKEIKTSILIGITKDTLTRTQFELSAKKTFLQNLFIHGGITESFVERAMDRKNN